ncbi:MAG: hypothetical protein QOE31_3012 [Solirubrobacteraceae bacterium]|jgi:hypothetical protein|nr:hypothetical protein [Solirubrobacteraceae bacterium]
MPYDPKNVMPAPPRYRPAEEDPNEDPGPKYDEDNAPTFTDLVKAAHKARKGLKKLKP